MPCKRAGTLTVSMSKRKRTSVMKKNSKNTKKARKPLGRPPIDIDYEKVRKMATFMFTDEELAVALGCNKKTLQRRKKDDPLFVEAIEEGYANGRKSLRAAQFKSAITDGNTTMQIWLGKQYLDQKDKSELAGPNGKPLQTAVIYLSDNGRDKTN